MMENRSWAVPSLEALENRSLLASAPITLTAISTAFDDPIGIDYHEPTDSMLVSIHFSDGLPFNFKRIGSNGRTVRFSNVRGFSDEIKIATVRSGGQGGFTVGDVFVGNGKDGEIARITDDGRTVFERWGSLPGRDNGLFRGGLYVDETGAFDGKLIAVTTTGQVWTISSDRKTELIAETNTHLEGVTVVPKDRATYGALAGKIIAGAENQSLLYAISPSGRVDSYDVGVAIEDIDLIPENQNFFGVNWGAGSILGASADEFASYVGGILLTQEYPSGSGSGLYHLVWDDNRPKAEEIRLSRQSVDVGQWEHVTFSPAGIAEIAPIVQPPEDTGVRSPAISVSPSDASASVGEVITANGEALAFGFDDNGDENQIVSVTVDGKPVDSLDVGTGRFTTRLTLEEGTNTFVFTATDELGQTADAELSLGGIPVARPDLVAIGLRQVPNGVEFRYAVADHAIQQDATAALYWLSDDSKGGIPTGPAAHQVNFNGAEGEYGPFRLNIPADLPAPPAGTTQVMLVLDPENRIHEADEATSDDFGANNVMVIPFSNSPPEFTELSVTPRINENDSVILQLVFADDDLSDEHAVTIDWGDGTDRSVEVVTVGGQQRSLEREYEYLDDQPSSVVGDDFVISVSVTDQKGVLSRSVVTTVNNLPPVVVAPDELTVGGDGTVSLPVSFTDVGTLDTHQASIDWGDGTPVFEMTAAYIDDGRFMATHEYGTGNTAYIATVRVTDDDGGVGEATTRVLPLALDILPTSLVIQDEQVSLEWQIRGQDIVVDSSVALFWSDDESFDPIDDSHVLSIGIEGDNRRMGTYDDLRQVSDITTELPPDSAEFLLMVVDPENTVELDDETNNVLATPLPMPDIEVLNAATSDFTFFQLSYQIREFPARPFVFGAYLSEDALLDEGDLRVEDLDGLAEYDASEAKWRYLGRHNVPDDFTAFVVDGGIEIEDARFVLIVADPDNRILEADEPNGTVGINNVAFAVPLLNNNQKRNRFGEINAQIDETDQDASGLASSSIPADSNLLARVDALFARSTVPLSCTQEECLAHPYAIDRLATLIDLLNAPQSQPTNPQSLIINSAWSETGDSPFHAAGRAFDFTPVFDGNDSGEKMGRFAGLAWLAGFDFVWRRSTNASGLPSDYIHASTTDVELVPGDTNFDGAADFTDFLTLSANFGLDNRIWSEGDFTGDGRTEFDDFLLLASAFGTE